MKISGVFLKLYVILTEVTVFEDKSMVHPLFGPMNIKQILEFMALHEKRHIEQIKELKESI